MKRPLSISQRANRILNVILVGLLLILARSWQLAVVQHEGRLENARRPQQREVLVRAERGTIRDRFNIPLAVNKVQYNASVIYSHIRDLPRGRKQHISKLSDMLASELNLDAERVEDLIHARAALFPNTPYVIASDIDEETFFRLKAREKAWVGLQAERVPKRIYPQERVACDIVGTMGQISREQYERVAREIETLESYLVRRNEGVIDEAPFGLASPLEVRERLLELKERAYSINDRVGKTGVELAFDEQLRGFHGKKAYQTDIYGTYVRELPQGKEAVSGERIVLTISSELQAFAEGLLAQSEQIREGASKTFDASTRTYVKLPQPFIKGGAIVAMDPKTGEVLALASTPRFDPNEGAHFSVGAIWDGREPLRREWGRREEAIPLDWKTYLRLAVGEESPITRALSRVGTVGNARHVQRAFEIIEARSGLSSAKEIIDSLYGKGRDASWMRDPDVLAAERFLDRYLTDLSMTYEKVLLIDLCRMVVGPHVDPSLEALSLSDFRGVNQAAVEIYAIAKEFCRDLFHDLDFRKWREEHGKAFLREKRAGERKNHRYARPYLDYLDGKEEEMFAAFWERGGPVLATLFVTGERLAVLEPYVTSLAAWADEIRAGAHSQIPWRESYERLAKIGIAPTLWKTLRSFDEMDRPLLGRYRQLEGPLERDLAAAFRPRYGFGIGRSYAYRQAAPQGSIFKVVTAFEAIRQREARGVRNLNPLTIVDDHHRSGEGWNVGFTMSGKPIPQKYKGGKILKTQRRHMGQIDVTQALEMSSNTYFSMLTVDCMADPNDLNRAAADFSYGARTGIELPGEYGGRLPDDLSFNRTGLYSYADGQHSLVVTPLQTAVMLSSLANGGQVFKPRIVKLTAGMDAARSPLFAYQGTLSLLGVAAPIFTSVRGGGEEITVWEKGPEVVRSLEIAKPVRDLVFEGMRRVVTGERGQARSSAIRTYNDYPWMLQDYRAIKPDLIGKTSTAEKIENVTLDALHGTNTYNHAWFGGISFHDCQKFQFESPELVVVVYLRFADYGREAAPLATQVIKKWREILTERPKEST